MFMERELQTTMLQGLYYRHEFARRNHNVVMASETALASFHGATNARGQQTAYILGENETLTDLIIRDYRDEKNTTTRAQMKKALSCFLDKYKVIPVPATGDKAFHPMKPTFLPYPARAAKRKKGVGPSLQALPTVSDETLFLLYGKILAFERFAAVELELRHPVFMPVMLLTGDNRHPPSPSTAMGVLCGGQGIPQGQKALLVDFSLASKQLRSHFAMCERFVVDVLEKGRPAEQEHDEKLAHIPWPDLDQYLGVFDCKHNPDIKQNNEVQLAEECLARYLPKEAMVKKKDHYGIPEAVRSEKRTERKIKKQPEPNYKGFYSWETRTYNRWLGEAEYWIENYSLIV